MDVRERLVQLIDASGMTQAEVARRLGEPPQWVNNRLRGETAIRADDIPRLAAVLRVSPSAFFQQSVLADVVLGMLLRLLADMPANYRAELLQLVAREEERQHPERGGSGVGGRDLLRDPLAARAARRLAQMWEELPEEEKRFIREMVEGGWGEHETG